MLMALVYVPLEWGLWFFVDVWGPGPDPSSKRTELVKMCKEIRDVLKDYFGLTAPSSSGGGCKMCKNKAKFWCVNCKKKYCTDCVLQHHFPRSVQEKHSIEELTETFAKRGVHFLSPIIPEIMVLAFVTLYLRRWAWVSEDYLTRANFCPIVDHARSWFAWLDPHLFYYFKASFNTGCNSEDSFWKILTDAWVRGIVTESDSTLLVLMNLPQALVFELGAVYLVVPIVATLYAIVLNLVYQIELMIPQTDMWLAIEKFTNMFDITTNPYISPSEAILSDMDKTAPETGYRLRPAMDFLDWFYYVKSRKLKYYRYFFNTTSHSISNSIWQLTMSVVVFRLGCCWLGLGSFVRWFLSLFGFRGVITKHQAWFGSRSGSVFVNEDMVWQTAGTLTRLAGAVLTRAPDAVVTTIMLISKLWFLIALLCTGCLVFAAYRLALQRREFVRRWEAGERERSLNFRAALERPGL